MFLFFVFYLFVIFVNFSKKTNLLFPFFFILPLFFVFAFLFICFFLSFFFVFTSSLHSGKSKVTRVTVGRDIHQPTKVIEFVKLILRSLNSN